MELVEQISEEDQTPTSAVCVKLIEEGLHARGYDVTSASKTVVRPSTPDPEWTEKVVSKNLKAGSSADLTEKDLKLLEVLKMLKEI